MKNVSLIVTLVALVLFGLFIILYYATIHIAPERVPTFEQAWVVSQVAGEKVASNEPKLVNIGETIKLYTVIAGKKHKQEELTYFTNAPGLKLDGKTIPADKIENWQRRWGVVKVLWFKIDTIKDTYIPVKDEDVLTITYNDDYCSEWGFAWDKIMEVAPEKDINIFTQELKIPQEYGTTRFKIQALIYAKDNPIIPFRKVNSPGNEAMDQFGIGDNVTRLSISDGDSLLGYYRAFYNLPYINFNEPPEVEGYRIEHFIGGNSLNYLLGALKLMGYKELRFGKLEELYKLTDNLFSEVVPDPQGYYYQNSAPNQRIRFGPAGVQVGDIILSGTHGGVISADKSPEGTPNGYLDSSDLVIHCWQGRLNEESLSDAFVPGFDVLRVKR